MNLPEPQSLTFSSLMGDIEKGFIKIPQFQRDFVWSKEKSAKLLDSIIKGYPIGTFIFWKTKDELRSLRNLGNVQLPKTPKGDFIHYVLDGQQRLTTLFASIKGLKIKREHGEDDFAEFYIDLNANNDESVILIGSNRKNGSGLIKLNDLLFGKLKLLSSFPDKQQDKIQLYKDRINAYQFSSVLIKDAPLDIATEIFTRLNVGGKPLTVFEIMVAKTFDTKRDFDLSEKYDELLSDLESVDYGSVPASIVLQTVSIFVKKECKKKDILKLPKKKFIDTWPLAVDAIKEAVDYFRNSYRIPVSQLLPYPNLIVPFAYYFYKTNRKPTGKKALLMQDFFWRAALGGRYSQSVDSRLSQDIKKMEAIISGKSPRYEWAVDISPEFIENNGWFSISRAYIKALLCILAYHEPKSFIDNSIVKISNDWLKRANSKNYHHFFPKSYLRKHNNDEIFINHIANITIVDDFLNKREIHAKAPSIYMKKYIKMNGEINKCMKTHLIDIDAFGVLENNYVQFFDKRCIKFSKELKKRIIKNDVDRTNTVLPAQETNQVEVE